MRHRSTPETRLPWDPPPGRFLRRLAWTVAGVFLAFFIVLVAAYLFMPIPEPNDHAIAEVSTVYYDGGKREIGKFGESNRVSVPLENVPQHVRDAVIAAENRNFYTDRGLSARGIARAVLSNLRGDSVQGGSTITQQYVKNYYLTQERTFGRKAKEAILALKIDQQLSKDEILENYLNTIYFGRGAYGVQTAAKAYFGKDVQKLSLSEGAALASLIRSPGRYDPAVNRPALQARMAYVLDAMAETGAITAEQTEQPMPSFRPVQASRRYGGQNGYIFSAVVAELERRGVDVAQLNAGGLKVETTLDEKAQESAVEAVKEEAPREDAKGLRIGLTAVEPGTGKVLAMYGGTDYLADQPHAQENNATARIQPGSIFKALALAAAVDQGISLYDRFHGNSPMDVPGSPPVRNQKNQDWGRSVSLLTATRESINTAFVDLALQVGGRKIAEAAERAGIPAKQMAGNVNARLALGIAPASAWQMAGVYATFAAEGMYAEPHIVARVMGPDGEEIELDKITKKRAFDKDVAAEVTYALRGVVQQGTGTRARALGRPAAAKTGTHESGNDIQTAWFVGYTPQLATAVSFFRGDGTESLNGVGGLRTFTGGRYPASVWTAFMQSALEGTRVERFGGRGVSGESDPQRIRRRSDDEPGPASTRTNEPAASSEPSPTGSKPKPTSRPPIVDCPIFCQTPSPEAPQEQDGGEPSPEPSPTG